MAVRPGAYTRATHAPHAPPALICCTFLVAIAIELTWQLLREKKSEVEHTDGTPGTPGTFSDTRDTKTAEASARRQGAAAFGTLTTSSAAAWRPRGSYDPRRAGPILSRPRDHDRGDHDRGDHDRGDHDRGDHDRGDEFGRDRAPRSTPARVSKLVASGRSCPKRAAELCPIVAPRLATTARGEFARGERPLVGGAISARVGQGSLQRCCVKSRLGRCDVVAAVSHENASLLVSAHRNFEGVWYQP